MSADKLIGFKIKSIVEETSAATTTKRHFLNIKEKINSISSFQASAHFLYSQKKFRKPHYLNSFQAIVAFLYPLQTSENQRFSDAEGRERQQWPKKSLNSDKLTISSTILTNEK